MVVSWNLLEARSFLVMLILLGEGIVLSCSALSSNVTYFCTIGTDRYTILCEFILLFVSKPTISFLLCSFILKSCNHHTKGCIYFACQIIGAFLHGLFNLTNSIYIHWGFFPSKFKSSSCLVFLCGYLNSLFQSCGFFYLINFPIMALSLTPSVKVSTNCI